MSKHAAVFIDRDGTLIRDVGYLRESRQIEVLPRVPDGLSLLREHGLKTVLVTNQSAVGRGFLTEVDLGLIHEELQRRVGRLDGVYYCPHHPTAALGSYRIECDCRKPAGGMVTRACHDLALDPGTSYVVGDKMSDVRMAARVGAKGILLRDCKGEEQQAADEFAVAETDFYAAARWIITDLSHD